MKELLLNIKQRLSSVLLDGLIFVGLFLQPIKSLLITVGILVAADLATGIIKAKKNKEEITSRRLRETVTKLLAYELVIILCYLIERFMLPDVPMSKILSGLIAITELLSVNENLFQITGNPIFNKINSKLDLIKEKEEGK